MLIRFHFVVFAVLLSACASLEQNARFSDHGLESWQAKVFNKSTDYRLLNYGDGKVVQANSKQSASTLYRRLPIDLSQTPYINWSWKVDKTLGELDEQMKVGDDYPARVYVILSTSLFVPSPRALCYVWASNTPAGGAWPSPYSKDVIIINLRSGNRQAGRWQSEKRNVAEDIRRHFGENTNYIEGIAIMTDTDDSQSAVTAYYGDIYFSRE